MGGEGVTVEEMVGWHRQSVDMSLSKLWETVKGREAQRAAVHGVAKSWTGLRQSSSSKPFGSLTSSTFNGTAQRGFKISLLSLGVLDAPPGLSQSSLSNPGLAGKGFGEILAVSILTSKL